MRERSAFTLIEVLIVISLLSLMAFSVLWSTQHAGDNVRLATDADSVAAAARQAHIFSREAKDRKTWGVALVSSNSYALVSTDGTTTTTEKSYSLSPGVMLANVFTVWFGRGTGTAPPITITLANKNGKQTDVIITETGIVEVDAR